VLLQITKFMIVCYGSNWKLLLQGEDKVESQDIMYWTSEGTVHVVQSPFHTCYLTKQHIKYIATVNVDK
jgi:hypothetical protein